MMRPVFTAVQVVPLLTEWKTPAPLVPAYRVVGDLGLMARDETILPYSGSCVQVSAVAARAAGTPTSTPERPKARHKVRINMIDRHVIHF